MTAFIVGKDILGVPSYTPELSDKIYTVLLTADTDTTLAIPAGYTKCIIGAETDYWVSYSAITLPAAAAFAETDAAQNIRALTVTAGATLHFRSEYANRLSVSFYQA